MNPREGDAAVARVVCLSCSREIPEADVNVGEGVAFCRACGHLSQLAEILNATPESGRVRSFDNPPAGCRIRDDGMETRVIASARSGASALGIAFACVFWNGIVSVFVLIALGGTIQAIAGSLPSWFPSPGNMGMPLGVVLFLWVFLLPFIGIGLMLFGTMLTHMGGRCEVRLRGTEGVLFTGVGPFGWKRRFDAGDIKSIRLGKTTWSQNDERQPCILIEANRTIRFGSVLPAERREWMASALRTLFGLS